MATPTPRRFLPYHRLLGLAACAGLAVCSSDSTRPEPEPPGLELPDGLQLVSCTGLSPIASSGIPLDRIDAGTVPAELESPFAALLLDADGGVLGAAWFEVDEGGRADLVVPLHPSGSIEGGEVLILATDGTGACEPWPFTIEPLPASPGELSAAVDDLQEILQAQAAALGSTPEELRTTALEDLPRLLAPLAIVQWMLDHPDNDASLRALADGSSPDASSLELTDAVLARTGFRAALANGPAAAPRATDRPARAVEPDECTPEGVGEDTQRLIDCMGLVGELVGEMAQALYPARETLAAAVIAESVIHGSVRSAVRDLGWVALQQQLQWTASLPRDLDDLAVDAEPPFFAEDSPLTGSWSATLTARSEGVSEEAMVEAWLTEFLVEITESGLRRIESQGLVPVDDDAEALAQRLIPPLVAQYLDLDNLPAETFGPVPVDDTMWSRVSYEALTGGGPSVEGVAHNTYRPIAVGRTEIVVQTRDEVFGLLRTSRGTAIVEVDSLIVRIEPSDTVVALGDTIDFRVTVENAHTKGPLTAGVSPAQAGGTILAFDPTGETSYVLRYHAPLLPSADSAFLDVLDASTEGARANGPPRADTARVRIAYLDITSGSECTPLDADPFQIETERSGWMDDADLIWSASLGSVDDSGLYTPPNTAGVDTVTVALRDHPEISDFIVLPVGGCSCQATLTVDGLAAATSTVSFTLTNDLSAVGAVSVRGGPFEQATFGFGTDPFAPESLPFGYTGPAEGAVSGTVGDVQFLNPDDPDDPAVAPLSVTIRENTGSLLAGTFSGEVAVPTNDPDPRITQLHFDFYIAADPTLSTDKVKRCEVPTGGA